MKNAASLSLLLLAACHLGAQSPEILLTPGLSIARSCRVNAKTYRLDAPSDLRAGEADAPVLTISGNDLVVDFQNAELCSNADPTRPDRFSGLAILVRGRNITIKNARVRGYKVALLAEGTDGLRVENCDFSYNYRPRLRSIREHEDFSDWLSYHQNDRNEWLRYGAGIYLDSCRQAIVHDCRITGNQNALLMTRCIGGLFYNNTFQFNSGIGIGLYRSSQNRVLHNRLDWNVRGYSHGFYQRGQDSAALLCYEQSNDNTFAFNSATHSGDGFFLWAGQTTMDTGAGGCNDNIIFGNNFSHAPTNGVEVTFSRNRVQGNLIRECNYGIWGGYSYESVFMGNLIADCRTGIAIEHGQDNTIRQNFFEADSTGIQFWARAEQPADWGYAQKRDTRSRDALVDRNVFLRVRKPLHIFASQNIAINGENLFSGYQILLETPKNNDSLRFYRNDLFGSTAQIERVWAHPALAPFRKLNSSHPDQQPPDPYAPLAIPYRELAEPDSLPGGMNTELPAYLPAGREHIHVNEWGPYDFNRPQAFLTNMIEAADGSATYQLQLIGPAGKWHIKQLLGVVAPALSSGTLPGTLSLQRPPGTEAIFIEFEYTGEQDFTDQFGQKVATGLPYRFVFERFEKKLDWNMRFFNLTDEQGKSVRDTAAQPLITGVLAGQTPAAEKNVSDVYFAWWASPAEGVQPDNFATVASTEFVIEKGRYAIELSSDDGVRLYLDGKRLLDHWDIHEPAVDEVEVPLGGKHTIRIEHFEAGGFGTLGLRIRALR
ncbi:MAG: right-handed parallel beta-helix repeat-containing protein [Saprospiraceae bacterium]